MALPEVRDFVRLHYAGKIYWLLLPIHYGAIAQMGERIVRNDEVVGSIPTSSTKFQINIFKAARLFFYEILIIKNIRCCV